MDILNLSDTAKTIIGWINSCKDENQIALCRDVIDRLIHERFRHQPDQLQFYKTLSELDLAIINRSKTFKMQMESHEIRVGEIRSRRISPSFKAGQLAGLRTFFAFILVIILISSCSSSRHPYGGPCSGNKDYVGFGRQ